MIVVGPGQREDSPISRLKELAGHQVSVHSEEAAVSVADQGGLLEGLRGRQEGGQAGGQRHQQDDGDGGQLQCQYQTGPLPRVPGIQAEWTTLIGPDPSRYCPLIGGTLICWCQGQCHNNTPQVLHWGVLCAFCYVVMA